MGKAAHIAEKNAKRMNDAFNGVNSTIKKITGSLGAYASVDMFVGLIKSAIDAQDELKDLSKSTSISIETLSGLGSAALKSGGDLESIAASINKLSVNIGKDADKFAKIGISAKDPIEAFKQLADVFNAIQDPQERAAFAAEALGKSWAGAAPLLAEGSKNIGEMVEKGAALSKVTAESAAKADELNDKLVDLQTITGSWTTQLANALVPSLLETAQAIEKVLQSGDKLDTMWSMFRGSIGSQRLSFDEDFAGQAQAIEGLQEQIKVLNSEKRQLLGDLPPDTLTPAIAKINREIEIATNQIAAFAKYKDKLSGPISTDAPLSGSRVSPDVSSFITEPKKKSSGRKGTAETVKELTVSTKDYQAAIDSLNSALNRAQSETLGLDQAQETLHNLMQSPEWGTYSEAMKWSAIEQASFASGALSAADAQSRLNALLADTPTAQLEKAREDIELLTKAMEAVPGNPKYQEAIEKINKGLEKGTDKVKEQKSVAEELGMSFSSAFEDAIVKGEDFSKVLQGIGEDILRIMVRKNITEPATTFFSGLFKENADGGVYNSPSLSAYSGGVYSSPKLFKFASGAGVFGEAGPEAIMPLKRGADGKLGVAGGASNVTVNVIEAPGSKNAGTTQTSQGDNGEQVITVFVEKIKNALIQDVGSGGSFASKLEGQYALNRAAGAWR